MVLCIQRATLGPELHVSMGPSPHLWLFANKRATLGPELHVSMGPRPHLSFCACKTTWFAPEWQVYMGSRPHLWFCEHIQACFAQEQKGYIDSSPHLWFCACKTVTLGLECQVSVGPRLLLLFLHAKQRLLDQNNNALCVPDMTSRFVHVQEHV